MTWRAAMLAAFLATLGQRRWWAVALAGFLVRGGLLLLLPAIVVLPTPAGLAAGVLDPSLTGAGLGSLGPALPGLVVIAVGAAAVVVVVTGLVGSWLDAWLVAEAADDEELEAIRRPESVPLVAGLAVRLIAHVPTLASTGVGIVVLIRAAYDELLSPSGTGSILGGVLVRAPLAVVVMVAAWLLGEAWGGLASRRLGLGAPVVGALWDGFARLARPSGLATLALTTAAVAAPIIVLDIAAGQAFERLWPLVGDRADPVLLALALVLFVGTWGAGLTLLGIAVAWRSAAWTAEVLRHR